MLKQISGVSLCLALLVSGCSVESLEDSDTISSELTLAACPGAPMTAADALSRIPSGADEAYLGDLKLSVERRACSTSGQCTSWVADKGINGNLKDYAGSYSANLSTSMYLDISSGAVRVRQEPSNYDAIFSCTPGDIGKPEMNCKAEYGPSFIKFQKGSLTNTCARIWGTSKVQQGANDWFEYRALFEGSPTKIVSNPTPPPVQTSFETEVAAPCPGAPLTSAEALSEIPSGADEAYLGDVRLFVERRACSTSGQCTSWVAEKGINGNLKDYAGSYSANLNTSMYLDISSGAVRVRQEPSNYDAIFSCTPGDIGKPEMNCKAEYGPSFIKFQKGSLTNTCARIWGTSKVQQGANDWMEYRAGFTGAPKLKAKAANNPNFDKDLASACPGAPMTSMDALSRIPSGADEAYLGDLKLSVERRACSTSGQCTSWVADKGINGNLKDYAGSYSANLNTSMYLDISSGAVRVRQEPSNYDAIFSCTPGDIGKPEMNCKAEYGPSFIKFQKGSLTNACARIWGTSKVQVGKTDWFEYRSAFAGSVKQP
ncbi:MAG: hypothetical protein KBF88_10755 [Polyangiaceae bacterium]|nr:hypothetical protein [Polyangiaceae bacterium]